MVATLARPGGNITGLSYFGQELSAKRLELIKEAFPRITRVAFLSNSAKSTSLQATESAAKSLKIEIHKFEVRRPSEFEGAFSVMIKTRIDAVAIHQSPMLNDNIAAIANLAAKTRLPSTGPKEFADAGGLIGYGVDPHDLFRRAASFVDRILKGAKAGDLPIERAAKFELVVNMKTARALGVTIPNTLLLRADKVIE